MTIGAVVEKYCPAKLAICLCQLSLPVFESKQTKWSSGVIKYSQFCHLPGPRLPVWVPPIVFQTLCHQTCPSTALIAQALSRVDAYSTPFTSRTAPTTRLDRPPLSFNAPVPSPPMIVGTAAGPPNPKPRPPVVGKPAVSRVLQARVRSFTLDWSICFKAL